MKKSKIIFSSLILIILFVACSSQKDKQNKDNQNINSKELKYIDNGGFYVNNKGEIVPKEEAKKYKKIVEWYFEPLCQYCITLETEVSPYITEIMGQNTLIKYIPMSFLGRPEGTDESYISYSDNISSNILSIVENDPQKGFKYLKEVLNQSFLDKIYVLGVKEEQEKFIEEIYTKYLSGEKIDVIKNSFNSSLEIVRNTTKSISKNDELKSKTKTGRISVPLVYVVGEEKALVFEKGKDTRKILEEVLK